MKLYGGIDLHSNNNVIALLDEASKPVLRERLANDLNCVLGTLEPFQESLEALAVESTYNWYWLVDGLQEAGYRVHLANTAAIGQYAGLKYSDDESDARWLAHLLRLGILPEGYIYPKEQRAVRDLLRKRLQLVQQRTRHVHSIQSLTARHRGHGLSGNHVKGLSEAQVDELFEDECVALAVNSHLTVMRCLDTQIEELKKAVKRRVGHEAGFKPLLSVSGIGQTLGLTILLETGDIGRFARAGNYASYCRCVSSERLSNGKRKGKGNTKNGNKYLAWAYVEAANFAVRYNPQIKRFYQRKRAKTHAVVAIKSVAHKLARACFYILRDRVAFDVDKAFA